MKRQTQNGETQNETPNAKHKAEHASRSASGPACRLPFGVSFEGSPFCSCRFRPHLSRGPAPSPRPPFRATLPSHFLKDPPLSPPPSDPAPSQDPTRGGILFATLAYGSWGVFPIYWKQLKHIPAFEVLCHRVLWSCLLVVGLLALTRRIALIRHALADPHTRRVLLASTALIAVNWFLFIWAITSGHILQASLGYYINPLVNVALGRIVLGERLSRGATAAVALAAVGVSVLAADTGTVPWVALLLAVTFALYGLCRKLAPVAPLTALSVETLLTAPLAAAALAVLASRHQSLSLHADTRTWLFLAGGGLATSIPLLAFAEAARRLRLATLGIVQYISPTLQFLCAVAVYREAFTRGHAVAFACIWGAVAVYGVDAWRRSARAG